MLNGARNADAEIELRRNHFARLADLPVVRAKPHVDSSAGGPDGRADRIGEVLHGLEARFVDQAASARDNARRYEFGTIGLGFGKLHEARIVVLRFGDHFFDNGVVAA